MLHAPQCHLAASLCECDMYPVVQANFGRQRTDRIAARQLAILRQSRRRWLAAVAAIVSTLALAAAIIALV